MTSDATFPRRFGKYKLLAELAEGGMGAVYLAASGSRGMEKVCALKVVLPSLATPEYCGRFLDEAKVMVRLSHGNLVQVFDVGEVDDESYIAMEYVEGQDLRSIWNRCVEVRRAFPVDVAIHLLKETCRALAYAHSYEGLSLVHRDISPPNIMATYSGETKVMDFGLAHSAIKLEHTSPGLVFGKVPYMSPEQARGDELDGRTDVYAVGVVLWELLTGRRLFPSKGDQAAEITERANNPQVASTREHTRRVPPKLDELVMKALAPDPADRFQSAEEMSTALGRFLSTNWPGTDNHRVGSFLTDLFGEERVEHRQRLESMLAEAAVLDEPDNPLDAAAEAAAAKAATEEEALFGGRYRLGRKLGEGGMGEVFEAEHEAIGKRVAVKVLHRGYGKSKDVVARFKREARAASRIDHRGITDVTDFGITDDKRLYFVMELLQGRLLSQALELSGAMSMVEAVDIGLQLCSAMTAAHEAGLVHRDLKPDNIILVPRTGGNEQVKILDFGIAKEMGSSGGEEMLTRPGTTLGTPEYMAPEQAAGQPADARSDVYAVGVLLYELLCGEPPHVGATAKEVLYKKLQDPIQPIDQRRVGIPEELSAVITRCLSASPDARPRSMREVALVLERVNESLAGNPLEPIPASVMSLPGGAPRSPFKRREATTEIVERHQGRRRNNMLLLIGGIGVLVVVGLLLVVRPWQDKNAAANTGGVKSSASANSNPEAFDGGAAAMDVPVMDFIGPEPMHGLPRPAMKGPRRAHSSRSNNDNGNGTNAGDGGTRPHVVEPPDMRHGKNGGDDPMARATVTRKSEKERARALLKAARGHIAAGRWAAARQSLLEAGKIRGYRGRALTGLARLSFQRGRYADAAAAARRAVAAGGGTRARLVLGNSQFKLGQYAAAVRTYRRILRSSPGNNTAKRYLKLAQSRLGQ